jgi:tRNA(fMet)-specific endonuclease VapC
MTQRESACDMTFFLDTNICIYALKGQFPGIARKLRQTPPASIKIPSIVKGELLFGALKSSQGERTLDVLERFLLPFEVVGLGDDAAASYSEIRFDLERRGQPVGPNDLVVAATVLAERGTLVTHNVREFQRIRHLVVEDWTK